MRRTLYVGVTSDLVSRFSAIDLVRAGATVLGGKTVYGDLAAR